MRVGTDEETIELSARTTTKVICHRRHLKGSASAQKKFIRIDAIEGVADNKGEN